MNYKLVQNYTVTKALNTKDHDPLILAGPFVALTIAENHLKCRKRNVTEFYTYSVSAQVFLPLG